MGQTVVIKYEHPVELNRLKIYETLNTIVVAMEAKKPGIIVDYYLIALRGRTLAANSPEAAVIPIVQKLKNSIRFERNLQERIWWYHLNIVNSFQYVKSFEGKEQLVERTCIVGVYNKVDYNLYFRCVYEYAELGVYLKN